MKLKHINPYVRAAMIQPAVMEGRCMRLAYDHRLFYNLDGTGTAITESGEYSIEPDSLLFLRPNYGYYFRGKMRVIVVNFDITRSADTRTEPICPVSSEDFSPSLLFDTESVDEFSNFILKTNADFLRDDLLELVRYANSSDSIHDIIASAILKKVLAGLAENDRCKNSSSKNLCESIKHYIHLYAPQIKSNRDLAGHFGYHQVYLAQLFRNTTGENLHQAIMEERIRIAKEWLRQTEQTVDEIAFGAGFSTRSHFCTYFKKSVGMSPTTYRKMTRQV